MSEMIERVARAIAAGWEDGSFEKSPDRWRLAAEAAIKAMREPTSAMVLADGACDTPYVCWYAMIDEALK